MSLEEVRELHELNTELMDLLLIIGKRFVQYKEKYHMQIAGMDTLAGLIERAQSIVDQIGADYSQSTLVNAIRHLDQRFESRQLTGKDESPEGNSTFDNDVCARQGTRTQSRKVLVGVWRQTYRSGLLGNETCDRLSMSYGFFPN